jgi:predicted Zn-dependent protease
MSSFFDRLAGSEGGTPAFLSTHPTSAGRAAAIRERAEALGKAKTERLPVDWDAVKASIR